MEARSGPRLVESFTGWWERRNRTVECRLVALYDTLGIAYWKPIVATTISSSLIMFWAALAVGTAYYTITAAQFIEIGAFASVCMVAAIAWINLAIRRGIGRPIWDWMAAGKPAEGAPAAWMAAVNLPFVSTWMMSSWRVILVVALPLGAFVKVAFSASWLAASTDACTLVALLPAALALIYFELELLVRPMKREAARIQLPELRAVRAVSSMRWRLLVAMTAISAGASMIAALLAAPAHLTLRVVLVDVPVGAGVAALLAFGLSVLFTESVVCPLDELVDATQGIRAGDLSVRVPVQSADELGILTSSFNAMAGELQRGREQMVTAREEERRRLRRDLHDDLGPTLAALVMQLELADNLLDRNPDQARALIRELKLQAQDGITSIRRVVYELRPPALDELGLVGAIRENAVRLTGAGNGRGPVFTLNAPERMPQLPAAVEVAAYRIVQEALTNLVRHAHAHACVVQLSLNGALDLEVRDDGIGIGIGAEHGGGVGLSSMRERAAELGGVLSIESPPGGGTVVHARLPVSSS